LALNWTPEVILDIFTASILIVLAIKICTSPKTKNIRSAKYISIATFISSAYFFLISISNLFFFVFITIIYNLLFIGVALFFIIAINYIMKDRLHSIGLFLIIILSTLVLYSAFQPPTTTIVFENGFYSIRAVGYFSFFVDLLFALLLIYMFYWGFKTFVYSPTFIKREAIIFFIGIILMSIFTLIIYLLYYIIPFLLIVFSIVFALGFLIFMFAIIREPKLLYILPLEINRILVKDREGFPLFDHDWSESSISDNMFSGFINAVQVMSEEVINKGSILDIILNEGILILRESEFITVGLIASKPSKLLRDSLINFSDEFENRFLKLLKTNCREMDKYDDAYYLIEKFFSNFPSKLISGKDHPLFLTMKYKELPPELENKMREIFRNEQEFGEMKKEIVKYPESAAWHFLKFYKENRDSISYSDEKSLEDKKILKKNNNNL